MKKMVLFVLSLLTLTLFGCREVRKQPDVITTLYPQYSITQSIAKDKLHTSLIIPIGSDGHHFTPTSRDIIEIQKAKLFILTSYTMEPWAKNLKGNKLDLSVGLEHEHGHDHDHDDVHYFVSIDNQIHMTHAILEELIKVDSQNKTFYEENAQKLITDLTHIKQQFLNLGNPTLYYIGHDVFESFSKESGITVHSLLSSFTDEANPTSKDIQTLMENIKRDNILVIYYDSLSMQELASTIKSDLADDGYNVSIRPFHSFHNVHLRDFHTNKTLADFWNENYEVLKEFYE